MSKIGSNIREKNNFSDNMSENKKLLNKISKISEEISLGGGKVGIEKQHNKGRLTARERIADFQTTLFRVSMLTGWVLLAAIIIHEPSTVGTQ